MNLETVVHPSRDHAIAVAAGTPDTGRSDATPRTKRRKGPATNFVVERNQQLSLLNLEPADELGPETWMLLHHLDPDLEQIRLELSLPDQMASGQVTSWRERIIVETVMFDLDVAMSPEEDDVIDVGVQRRAS